MDFYKIDPSIVSIIVSHDLDAVEVDGPYLRSIEGGCLIEM